MHAAQLENRWHFDWLTIKRFRSHQAPNTGQIVVLIWRIEGQLQIAGAGVDLIPDAAQIALNVREARAAPLDKEIHDQRTGFIELADTHQTLFAVFRNRSIPLRQNRFAGAFGTSHANLNAGLGSLSPRLLIWFYT